MLGAASLDALRRIAERANDVLAAYAPGAVPLHDDVNADGVPFPSTDPLSVAAPPGTWFATSDAQGVRRYTRDGGFRVGDDGTLRAADGAAVLGVPRGGSAAEPLRLPQPDLALGRCTDVRIDDDGSLSYTRGAIDPRSRERSIERVVVGRVALARFPAGAKPQRIDATHFAAMPGVAPHVGAPADGTFGPLAVGARDRGNVDIDTSLQRLQEAYVAFSALGAMQRAHSAFDKTATELVK